VILPLACSAGVATTYALTGPDDRPEPTAELELVLCVSEGDQLVCNNGRTYPAARDTVSVATPEIRIAPTIRETAVPYCTPSADGVLCTAPLIITDRARGP
jgi:hypothetical protein